MARTMKLLALLTVSGTIVFSVLFAVTGNKALYSWAISLGTTAYHFVMRLGVGLIYNSLMKNRANYHKSWYRVRSWEKKLYKAIKVKKWKDRMPTFNSDFFDISKHSWDEIAQAGCQAELVHETIVVLSLLPVICSVWFGELAVFLITSVIAALIDLLFVIMQRYNRPRLIRMTEMKNKRSKQEGDK